MLLLFSGTQIGTLRSIAKQSLGGHYLHIESILRPEPSECPVDNSPGAFLVVKITHVITTTYKILNCGQSP